MGAQLLVEMGGLIEQIRRCMGCFGGGRFDAGLWARGF